MKKIFAAVLCGLMVLTGCSENTISPEISSDAPEVSAPLDGVPQNTVSSAPTVTLIEESESVSETSESANEPAESEPKAPNFSEIEPAVFTTAPEDFYEIFEIEDGIAGNGAEKTDIREGFSGDGYVSCLPDGEVILKVEIPSPQHYNITVRAAADSPCSGKLLIDGSPCGNFTVSGASSFETLRFDNVYLDEGSVVFGFSGLDFQIDLDCVIVEDSPAVYELKYDAGELSNKNADGCAAELYSYMKDLYGNAVLSGQQVSQGSNAELDEIYFTTGKYPAIRFGELMDYSAGIDSGDVELASEWAKSGGIVGYSWYWTMNGSVYAEKTSFDLSAARTDLDIAAMDGGALALRYNSGDITLETLAVIDGIDLVAAQLEKLKNEGVAVIFRPLPEAGGGQFWWSQSPEDYIWLYKLIYERLSGYWSLNNLIWVWNGQSEAFYPGDEMTDVISLDIYYPEGDPGLGTSGVNFFVGANGSAPDKLIAMSECSFLPSPDMISRDNAFWSYCSAWTGEYAVGGRYMQTQDWIMFYNNSIVITKDEIEYNR